MIEKELASLGFSPSEIKIYIHLLTTGSSYANKISSETRINRTNVYEALDRLITKGIISLIIKNKVKWFQASTVDSLLNMIREKEDELLITKNNIFREISSLKPINTKPLEASIFVGKKGLRMIFEEIIQTKKPISLIASKLQFKEVFGPYFDLWHKRRIELGIKQRSIFPKTISSELKRRELLEYKFIDHQFANPTTTIIYGENCVFIQWSKKPFVLKINNKEIVISHLNYFNALWNREV